MREFLLAHERDKDYNILMFGNPHNTFLKSSSVGLHISDESLKYIELIKTAKGIKIGRHGERKIPRGIIESGKIKDREWLEQVLMLFRKEEGIKSAHISLPYELFDKHEQNLGIEVADGLENTIEEYLSVFKNSMISAKSIGFEAEAVAEAVIPKNDKGTYMIVDFGKKRTGIFIVSACVVIFTSILEFGGAKLAEMIKENVSILCDEVKKHFVYWHVYKDENGKKNLPIKKIILCGSDGGIKGLSEYLSVATRSKVELANVWTNILNTEKMIPEINFNESLNLASPLGIALKGFDKKRN
jgi:hypothetical protein